jgi:hypothetical protein
LQLRNLQSPVEIGVDKNTTVGFRAPLMSTIEEIGSFLAREKAAALSQAALIQAALTLPDTQPPAGGRQRPAQRRPKAAEHVATRTRARH